MAAAFILAFLCLSGEALASGIDDKEGGFLPADGEQNLTVIESRAFWSLERNPRPAILTMLITGKSPRVLWSTKDSRNTFEIKMAGGVAGVEKIRFDPRDTDADYQYPGRSEIFSVDLRTGVRRSVVTASFDAYKDCGAMLKLEHVTSAGGLVVSRYERERVECGASRDRDVVTHSLHSTASTSVLLTTEDRPRESLQNRRWGGLFAGWQTNEVTPVLVEDDWLMTSSFGYVLLTSPSRGSSVDAPFGPSLSPHFAMSASGRIIFTNPGFGEMKQGTPFCEAGSLTNCSELHGRRTSDGENSSQFGFCDERVFEIAWGKSDSALYMRRADGSNRRFIQKGRFDAMWCSDSRAVIGNISNRSARLKIVRLAK